MRLIDADRLKSYIDCGHLRPPTEVCFSELDVCNMIDKAPTVSAEAVHKPDYSYEADMVRRLKEALSAEVVEVVRCKDCKHYKKINPKVKSGICYKDIVASAWNDDGFCSRGERKGGDDE